MSGSFESLSQALSQQLYESGFFSALGTLQNNGSVVKRGRPLTYDYNNGVHVIYDQQGWPWIVHRSQTSGELIAELVIDYALMQGAFVPHSNDGGKFILQTLPELLGGE